MHEPVNRCGTVDVGGRACGRRPEASSLAREASDKEDEPAKSFNEWRGVDSRIRTESSNCNPLSLEIIIILARLGSRGVEVESIC